jgi:hypothetical protein
MKMSAKMAQTNPVSVEVATRTIGGGEKHRQAKDRHTPADRTNHPDMYQRTCTKGHVPAVRSLRTVRTLRLSVTGGR